MGNSVSTSSSELIEEIESSYMCKNHEEMDKLITSLFDKYDKDNSGYITGYEINSPLIDICDFICERENIDVTKKPLIRRIIDDILDVNRDGKISKREFQKKFVKCLDIRNCNHGAK